VSDKQLAKGELRYVARPSAAGGPRSKTTVWNVYDRLTGSWPVIRRAPVGKVKQDMATEEEALEEAARLETAVDVD
jgi:hypothetical protein